MAPLVKEDKVLDQYAVRYRDEAIPSKERRRALEELIAAYADDCDSCRRGEAGRWLVELLQEPIVRIARQVAKGGCKGDRIDFVDEAMTLLFAPRTGHMPRICLFRPQDNALEPWLWTVLNNSWISRQRQRKGKAVSLQTADTVVDERVTYAADELNPALFWTTPFSNADLAQVQTWPVKVRLEILCLGGMWCKVPAAVWEDWLRAWEVAANHQLFRPFPSREFAELAVPAARIGPLAGAMQLRANTLAVRWHRYHGRLNELDCVRGLMVV